MCAIYDGTNIKEAGYIVYERVICNADIGFYKILFN